MFTQCTFYTQKDAFYFVYQNPINISHPHAFPYGNINEGSRLLLGKTWRDIYFS
jgi:hypothetical protein